MASEQSTAGGKRSSTMIDRDEAARIERMAVALSDSSSAPPWAAPYLKQAAPVIGIVCAGAEAMGPIIFRLGAGIYAIYQKLPKTAVHCLWGFGLCFYGGRYSVTFAAIEAFSAIGGSQMMMCLNDIVDQITQLREAHLEDNKVDEDGNGKADVDEADAKTLVQRKVLLAMRTVDPEKLSDAVGGLWSGYMGILAVLKFQFAQTVALAHSIGDSLRPAAAKLFAPSLITVTPRPYQRWINPALNFGCKVIAGFLAWRIQRGISTVQSGMKGGLIAARSFIAVLRERGYWATPDDQTFVDELGGYSLATCGIYYQMFKGGLPMPFIFKPLFWPVDMLEWWLHATPILHTMRRALSQRWSRFGIFRKAPTSAYYSCTATVRDVRAQLSRYHRQGFEYQHAVPENGASLWCLAGATAASLVLAPGMLSCNDAQAAGIETPWAERIGEQATRLQLTERVERLSKRVDKQFIWQTCSGPRGIEDVKIYQCPKPADASFQGAQTQVVAGKTRICATIRVGDMLNGHIGLLHGGFTAALLDDMTGLASWLEKEAQDMAQNAQIFTANLTTNYRRPLPCDSEYLVEVIVDRIEKSKKIFLTAAIYDRHGNPCVDATALYIVKVV